MQEEENRTGKKKMGLTTKIFIGLIGGLVLGVVLNLWIPGMIFSWMGSFMSLGTDLSV